MLNELFARFDRLAEVMINNFYTFLTSYINLCNGLWVYISKVNLFNNQKYVVFFIALCVNPNLRLFPLFFLL